MNTKKSADLVGQTIASIELDYFGMHKISFTSGASLLVNLRYLESYRGPKKLAPKVEPPAGTTLLVTAKTESQVKTTKNALRGDGILFYEVKTEKGHSKFFVADDKHKAARKAMPCFR